MPPDIADDTVTSVALTRLAGIDLRSAEDGWHGIWTANGATHQFWLAGAPPETVARFVVTLPLDALFELRVHAARRFWRALNGRSPGSPFRTMPEQLRQFHTLSLRALDARQHGESYRTIAEVLLGFRGSKEDWEIDPRRNQARRLVAHAVYMMQGGYRLLLHYPVKLTRRR
ncbi:DUF2285 domain-containing protein [Sinirhodobacter populi]|uniref:DUF2285 domain-containing protein n=1 Tax=Paenirhodobacter populi TaxID=2306993 RepID=A0A443JYH5_9RHOB|nr:DUF2285 domain-containing protein [Sinirhodobacter populi]RWR25583.1 DUF2285 domain-containing protein [Sinirhodobacter populi]